MTVRLATQEEMQERARKQQEILKRQAECLRFMQRGLTVIHDRILLMELEIAAGLSPKTDLEHYKGALKTALMRRTEELYDAETISPVFAQAKVNLTEYGR